MDRGAKTAIGIILLCGIIIGQVFFRSNEYVSSYYPIYKATLPFGVFSIKGEIGGMFIFGFGGISGYVGNEETYLIKYFDGDELKSLSLKAENVPIVVDGTLMLEEITIDTKQYILFWKVKFKGDMIRARRLHIPYLPEVNQTLTEDWTR